MPVSRSGRALVGFWAAAALAAAGLAGTLQWLGPPVRIAATGALDRHAKTAMAFHPATPKAGPKPAPKVGPANPASAPEPSMSKPLPIQPAIRPGIALPDPALLEPAPHEAGMMLPRIAHDGREARQVYAAMPPILPAGARRISILLEGVGLSSADSLDAIDQLPAAVSLAVSPYAVEPGAVLDAARKAGHELLLSLPMEPAASADDEGAKALTMEVDAAENARRLEWSLSRLQGYAGVTNGLSGLDGQAFAASLDFLPVAQLLAARGLFYLDATPDDSGPGKVADVSTDLRLDDPPTAGGIDRQLARLEQIAQGKGSALGVAGPLYPVTIRRLAAWARVLPSHGLVLVPVSSLIHPVPQAAAPGSPR